MPSLVNQIIADELRGLGFRNTRSDWHRNRTDVVHVVGVQKSQWGQSYYINIGIWMNAIAIHQRPRIRDCHLRCRIDSLPDIPLELEDALNEEDVWRMEPDQRKEIIRLALNTSEFLFFRELESTDSVLKLVAEARIPQLAVMREVRELI